MYLHPTYAVSTTREPLGVVDAWMWARKAKSTEGQCANVKESERWIEGYERVTECARQLPKVRQVYVADREADIMALLRKTSELNHAGKPGAKTLWLGMRQLAGFVQGIRLAKMTL